ncbi:MAG: DoxX family protein [Rhodospirillaceae bacterium]|nr:DoxX family protein [Rhodospirillaceae bacterium]
MIAKLTETHAQVTDVLARYASPVFDVAVRLFIASIFFKSGLTKIKDWDITVSLFADEYQVPVLPPEIAAFLGTTFELTMPVFLALGLGARLAALPLLGMACVIQFVLGAANPDYDNPMHFYWMFLLGMIIVKGPGPISLDGLMRARLSHGPASRS